MASLDLLPNELLCNILGMLSTKEKFRAREVCSRWKGVVDESVPFYGVQLYDQNYDEVAMRFGRRRVSSLKFPCLSDDYTKHCIPIQNLSHLRRLSLTRSLSVDALADLVKRADKLIELKIKYLSLRGSNWHNKDQIAALLPALRKVQKLYLPQYYLGTNTIILNSWIPIIRQEMPELQRLEIDVSFRNPTHFNFLELATLKPHLRELVIQDASEFGGFSSYKRVTAVWDLKSCNAKGLQKLKLLGRASRLINEAPQFETLLSNQNNMQELQLYDSDAFSKGPRFSISLIQPVLRKSMETLHTIRLDIRAERKGTRDDFDMEIFAQFPTLRELHLSVWEIKYSALYGTQKNDLRGIKNCSTVISATLCKLFLHGFTFSTEEASDCIRKICKLDLEKVDFFRSGMPEISTAWKWFSRRAKEMGLKKDVQVKTLYLPAKFAGVEFHFEHRKSSSC